MLEIMQDDNMALSVDRNDQPLAPASLANVMDLLLDAVCVVDAAGRFVFVSAACERIFGYTAAEMLGRAMIEFVFPADRTRTLNAVDEIVAGQQKNHFENRYVRKDGRVVDIMWSARWSESDQVRIAVARDVTALKHAQLLQAALYAISEAAHAAEDLLVLFKRIHRVIGGLLPANNFFVALYDPKREELSFPYYVDERGHAPAPEKLDSHTLSAELIRTGRALRFTPDVGTPELVQLDIDKAVLDWIGVPLFSLKGVVGALVVHSYSAATRYTEQDMELLQYVSTQVAAAIERKQMEQHLQHMALHDQLTNLPNRQLLHDRLQIALAWARRERTQLSLLYLDLDMFKQVNDTFGHVVGDQLLQEVAHRLTRCVRESDTVGRVGGDEFLVLLNSVQSAEHAAAVAEKIRTTLAEPFELCGQHLTISPSIGIALYPEHGADYRQLLAHADKAMYDAKRSGGNRFEGAAGLVVSADER